MAEPVASGLSTSAGPAGGGWTVRTPARRASMTAVADVVAVGKVRTMDPSAPVAEAVAVRDDRIVAVGTVDDARRALRAGAEVIGAPNELVLPGFQDAHVHPPISGLERLRCDLNGTLDATEYVRLVADYARAHPDEAWIAGGGWWPGSFPGGLPRREALDAVVPDRPVYLPNRDGHGAWVNSRALELAGIDAWTPDPADGRIQRDPETGEPTGVLHEGAMDLVETLLPETTPEEWERAILEAQGYLHSLGITAWQDAWVKPEQLGPYLSLSERGDLTARVVAALWWERDRGLEQVGELIERRDGAAASGLDARTVKIMLDGVCENFTARMLEPYLDDSGRPTGNRGLRFVEPETLRAGVTRLDAEGFQVHFHAIGDGAVRDALHAVEAAQLANGPGDARHHIAHIQVIHPDDVPRFARLGVVANAQTLWACHEPQMDDLTIPFLGPERTQWQYPFRALIDAGARLACGSDWSVSSPDPFLQMHTAVTRVGPEEPDAPAFLPEQRLTADQALTAFTRGSAFVNRLDDRTGVLRPGALADLVVADHDPFEDGSIADTRVVLTMVGGRVVFDRG
jgi:predicted amidohydrolase YtcJ